jgi:hypothetical protein
MRHPLVPALLVVLLLAAYGVGGVALVDGAVRSDGGGAEAVTVSGTVTSPAGGPAGDATVLIGDYGMLSKLTPDELRSVAADDPADLAVVETAADGSFSATVDRRRADSVAALSDGGVSETVRLGNQNATVDLQLHERRPQTVYAAVSSVSHGETRTRLYVSLVNNGDEPVENLTVTVGALPAGWSVADVETAGNYDDATGTLTWSSVATGGEVDTTITLAVPADEAVGEYTIGLAGGSASHPVTVENGTAEVRPEDTAGPTKTYLEGDGATATTGDGDDERTETPGMTDGTTPTPTPTSTPGLGVLLAVGAVLAGAVVAARRADSD